MQSIPHKIGILGAGQLGRMMAMAAHRLGLETLIYAPDAATSPAGQASPFIAGAWDDLAAIEDFLSQISVVTYEFENIPRQTIDFIDQHKPLYPSKQALNICRNRIEEKRFIASLGLPVAPFTAIASESDLKAEIDEKGRQFILKSAEFGYDGHGQFDVSHDEGLTAAYQAFPELILKSNGAVLEAKQKLDKEFSLIFVRNKKGAMVHFEPAHNIHEDHILHRSILPANLPESSVEDAIKIGHKIMNALHYIGILAIEFFINDQGTLLVNEMAPRPHNSGHWSMDGANLSQFELAIRAIAGLELISPQRIFKQVEMLNLLGDDIASLEKFYHDPQAKLHLYGKKTPKKGRKMGHVNFIKWD